MQLTFYKYQGTGNDFIILDNRNGTIQLTTEQINFLCNRKFGIGADGLMLLSHNKDFDFEMVYYNADGKESTMCGNGGRCLVQFAYDIGLKKEKYHFKAIDGPHEAHFEKNGWVDLLMKNVDTIERYYGDFLVNTGSPHYIKTVTDIANYEVFKEGRAIRFSKDFEKEGINVNFVEVTDADTITVRTYERGVENETLSCGTGVTAAALVFAHNEAGFNRIEVNTLGGKLAVEFDKLGETFTNIWLCGPATFVFKGEIYLQF
ncbi:MAG: diaminopimelate epimerase [Hydrotalea flava]|uniref:diaminopimelate epimerase n=1 Tax=Hydrotalea flava TaxID=714549 RepID=UPI00082CF3F5|nr:diaminopimelate epimerase [Hydrotalea flava]RTL52007.1 MAG: diaminopimelate epimerase [Sphingobacteriales bacterium]NIM34568.1 diaminopimelate epimerase [Hydrotalea flava]NIM37408.1 diaminopimelate epimerase [Hydrotalea flava]NIN02593.1 diaminopimelate epimerase [Hydrotalea flava]NIN14253.1 diaminopimelate epimerase [Hydrotalea flava]